MQIVLIPINLWDTIIHKHFSREIHMPLGFIWMFMKKDLINIQKFNLLKARFCI